MKKIASILVGTLFSIASITPSMAADDGKLKTVAMLPVKMVAFGAGAVVGTPIAIVRKTAQNTKAATKSIAGDNAHPVKVGAAALLGIPVGLFTGGLEGSYWGTANAWTNSSEHPFGKDSFSLGEMKD